MRFLFYCVCGALFGAAMMSSKAGACGDEIPRGESSDEASSLPPILDPQFRHPKKYQFELSAFGGNYVGPSVKKSWLAGGRLHFHLNGMFAVGVSYGFQWLAVDSLTCAGPPIDGRDTHYLDGELVISNDMAIRFGSQVVESDLFLTLGLGSVLIDRHWEVLGVLGGGVKFYTALPWLAIRIDVNTYLHRVRQPARDAFDTNVSFMFGLTFLLPTESSP